MRKFKLSVFMLTVILFLVPSAGANVFYTSSNYATGSAGVITADGGFKVQKDITVNLANDAQGFTFTDHDGNTRAMARERYVGKNDTIFVWDPANWSVVFNESAWGANIHAVASSGRYLYLATYENASGGDQPGEVVRVDMANGYRADKRYSFTASYKNDKYCTPHGEGLYISGGGDVYVLVDNPYNGVEQYEASEIWKFDGDLNFIETVKLDNGAAGAGRKFGKNAGISAETMAYHNGRLYVTCAGGYQGPNSVGDVWQVSISGAKMTAAQVLDGADSKFYFEVGGYPVNVGMYGIQFASDGTAYLLTGSYTDEDPSDRSQRFRCRLFVTTEAAMAAGDPGTVAATYTTNTGYSWGILWDEPSSVLWS